MLSTPHKTPSLRITSFGRRQGVAQFHGVQLVFCYRAGLSRGFHQRFVGVHGGDDAVEQEGNFIGVILAFVVLMIGNTVYGFAEHIFNKKIPIAIITRILLFRTPAMFVLGFPLATLFAVVLTMGRLARDSEIIAMRTSGVSRMRIFAPVFVFAFFISILTLFINERIVPWANHESQKDVLVFIHSNIAETAKPNVFFRLPGDMVMHANGYDEATGSLSDILLLDIQGHGFLKVMKVKKGDQLWVKECFARCPKAFKAG